MKYAYTSLCRFVLAEMMELVDMLRLERSALRCVGSSPTLGI